MENKKFTIIINTYPSDGRDEQLSRCLSSLFAQSYQNFDILLVENYKNEKELTAVLNEFKNEMHRISIMHDSTKKLSHLFDIAWRHTKNENLSYIADDVDVEIHWLESVNEELNSSKEIAVVTGPIISAIFPEGEMHRLYYISQKNILLKILAWPYIHFAMEDQPFLPGKLFESGAYSMGAAIKGAMNYSRQEIDLATTSSMGIKRSVLEKIGGFDKNFNFNHADGDLFIRIKKAGYKIIFTPKAVSHHHLRLGPSRNAYIIGLDTGYYFKKHVRPKSFSGFLGAIINILILNLYWIYNTARTKDTKQLKGISGFIEGIIKHVKQQ